MSETGEDQLVAQSPMIYAQLVSPSVLNPVLEQESNDKESLDSADDEESLSDRDPVEPI